eukprot:2354913-Pleurochrysis_carterae.AAC.1
MLVHVHAASRTRDTLTSMRLQAFAWIFRLAPACNARACKQPPADACIPNRRHARFPAHARLLACALTHTQRAFILPSPFRVYFRTLAGSESKLNAMRGALKLGCDTLFATVL